MTVTIPVDISKIDVTKPVNFFWYNPTTKKAEEIVCIIYQPKFTRVAKKEEIFDLLQSKLYLVRSEEISIFNYLSRKQVII